MLMSEVIEVLKKYEIPFEEKEIEGKVEFVYAYDKGQFEKKNSGQTQEYVYVPYLRMSHFKQNSTYTRYSGYCSTVDNRELKELIKSLA